MPSAMDAERSTLTVTVSNIPQTAVANELLTFLESKTGVSTIYAVEIFTEHQNWKSRGHGRVQFDTPEAKAKCLLLSEERKLVFKEFYLSISHSFYDIIARPVEAANRVEVNVLAGVMVRHDRFGILERWNGVEVWVMPERRKVEWFVNHEEESYKLEVQFGDVLETRPCSIGGKDDAILLKLNCAPKVFKRISGPKFSSKFATNRYRICKENFDFLWVRTTDFSHVRSIGYLTTLCWKIEEGICSDVYTALPCYSKDVMTLELEKGVKFSLSSDLVPIVQNSPAFPVAFEVLFQLNSLVHAHKISLAAVDGELLKILNGLNTNTAVVILKKMHKLHSTCYDPKFFIKQQLSNTSEAGKDLGSITYKRLKNQNVMSCHRVLVTPSRFFCLGPELESSNYIVRNFAEYSSDFLRVTFVDEDWGRLPTSAVSMTVSQGIYSKPYRTNVYHRILSVLRDGIVIGEKHFQFLAFSASQLRSNSVWMFASNEYVKAEEIRQWMGCFNKIRNISKCAARMGQLFSSSKQTIEVHPRDVELIPDIDVNSHGVTYCFSDGIGKISHRFAEEISRMLGLSEIPSAFQIRYGGYKGVVAVDRQSYRKLSLRSSMLKFESDNYMLNITKWTESQPCYLNREIVTLLSTLGVEDSVFLAMQEEQLQLLCGMLTNKDAALNVLESTGGGEMKSVLGRMLLQGYTPQKEPYLSTMLRSHLESQLSDLRGRCRIFVPKGRVLVGCLDEHRTLEYGQIYARVTMTKSEMKSSNKSFFRKVDKTSAVVTGKVVVTKNPCLHPGDIRVLEAVFDEKLYKANLVDCLVFPQKGDRPHPNECSGGDLDGDLYFISWDQNLIPPRTVAPMDYTGRRARITDHDVTLEEIQKFFADYMISDTLGAISTAHLIHAGREPDKALSPKCLELATLHSMAVDFAKTGAPAEMPRSLKPREFPDFLERWEKPMYISLDPLGKLYRATIHFIRQTKPTPDHLDKIPSDAFDHDLIVDGYKAFLKAAEGHKEQYLEKMGTLMNYYGAEAEVEILTGELQKKTSYLQRDNRRYGEVKERILVSVKSLMKEVKEWLGSCCGQDKQQQQQLVSAWYYVTYHPSYSHGSANCLAFPWAVGNVLLDIKSAKIRSNGVSE
ncbi:RNA-dependent RNA polymerase 2 [Andrographis paniculata]|uniref:RNA-dependent RNA polymerase 2 n=1 Tax=Andrographis paniculata TaxID=175694 RepID=UPI0021E8B105|nr:RNA-dependent RNA polymerase 2 [Andrographis paniculata]XP_051136634.1 RNA-dependent RNA polymerase 2 [Andrographis paniculata]